MAPQGVATQRISPLSDGLAIRMASSILNVRYRIYEGTDGRLPSGTVWHAGFSFDPTLQLRIEL